MIYTSYFSNPLIWQSRLQKIAISLKVPYNCHCEHYILLAPTKGILTLAREKKFEEYRKRYYEEILSRMDVKRTYRYLNNSIILCWERPERFCHRHIVAEWLQAGTGKQIEEFQHK